MIWGTLGCPQDLQPRTTWFLRVKVEAGRRKHPKVRVPGVGLGLEGGGF